MRGVTSQWTTTTNTFTRSLTPDDSHMVTRLVGFLEYANALKNLDALVSASSEDELAVIDEIVKKRDEFTVYTNLSRRFQKRPSSLAESAKDSQDRFEQRGLAWVIALARAELGAMLAGFTNSPDPFEIVGPTQYEMAEYKELLLDGVRSHYWALSNDPNLKRVSRMSPVHTQVLSYSRRLVLARAMMRAAMKAAATEYSPIQKQELTSWKSDLDALQAGFVIKIQSYLRQSDTESKTQLTQNPYTIACGALLRAEQRERAAGTATDSTFRR